MTKSFIYYTGLVLSLLIIGVCADGQPRSNKPTTQSQVPSVSSGNIRSVPSAYASGSKVSYIRTREALGRITDTGTFNSATYDIVREMTQYVDGLGRPLQTVNRQITPQAKDLVTPVLYDSLGREEYQYLPYVPDTGTTATNGKFKLSPFTSQATFYGSYTLNPGCVGEQTYYSRVLFETSLLNRVLKTMAPGNSWAGANSGGRGIEQQYMVNTVADSVRVWQITNDTLTYTSSDTGINIPTTTAYYSKGQLYKNVTKDESGNAAVEYTDKEGELILKKVQISTVASDFSGYTGFLSTYYIYDDFKNLRFVIQPKGVAQLLSNWQLHTPIVNELCFRYEYDSRQRMMAKKIPGADWAYLVYDACDRLVFTQDSYLRTGNQWMTTLYDPLSRVVTTGFIPYSGKRNSLQNYVTQQTTTASTSNTRIVTSTLQSELDVTTRQSGVTRYEATHKVVILPNFVSEPSASFVVHIVNSASSADTTISVIASNPLPMSSDSLVVLTLTHYDDYSWSPSASYSESFRNKLDSGNNTNFESNLTLAEQQHVFTKGLTTITRVRTIEDPANIATGGMLTTTSFYDDRDRVIQVQRDNYKGGKDTITNRYDFSGKVLSSYVAHNNPAAGARGIVKVKTSLDYDFAGRLLKVWKTINDDVANKELLVYNYYDELGRLKTKEFGNTTGPEIETLDYTYNIRGWLKSINRGYANDRSAYNNRYFGEEISYDWGFDSAQYNGNISGVKWQGRGTDTRRAYGYTYDKANRLMGADFTLGAYVSSDFYDYSSNNYDMQMGNGRDPVTAYDENGNILAMKQWGQNLYNSQVIDNLRYNYSINSNKLLNVIDTANDAQTKLGDFRTSSHHPNYGSKTTSTVDYTYDGNGNLLKDLNKDIGTSSLSGIQYNHLNLPYKVTVYGSTGVKGTITYIYDAAGNKLEKRVTDSGLADTKTDYIGPFVYENNQLQFFTHEEGRTRYTKKYFVNGDSAYQFMHDYFIKDHLGNIRMVLTEQKDTARYIATMEPPYRGKEDALFNNVTLTAYPDSLVPGGYPVDTSVTNPNSYVSRLNGSGNMIGPSIVLKVMGGDQIDIATKVFYRSQGSRGSSGNSVADIVASLANGIISVSGTTKGSFSDLTNSSIAPLQSTISGFLSGRDYYDTITVSPKAYINVLLFDENLQAYDGVAYPIGPANTLNTISTAIDVTTNGYFYIYLSNETQNWDVFFDNLVVNHRPGALLEETHYYPFGLTMAGLSDRAFKPGYSENRHKYNGIEYDSTLGIDEYEANYRDLDPQTGRWWQIDPKIENGMEGASPYASNYDNPIRYSDPLGDEGNECCGGLVNAVKQFGKDMYNTVVYDARVINTYANPVSPFVEVATGKSVESDFTKTKSRVVAGGEAALAVFPIGRVAGVVGKVTEKVAEKTIVKETENAVVKETEKVLSRKGALNEVKKDLEIPKSQHPDKLPSGKQYEKVPMTDRNGKAILGSDGKPIMTREYTYTKPNGQKVIVQDHSAGHPQFEPSDPGKHFNVRPPENTRTGKVPGTKDHYPFN